MASIAHALMLAPPVVGKIYNWSFTVGTGVDLNTGLGVGAESAGGYVNVKFSADCYYGWGSTASSTITPTGTNCGMPATANVEYTFEIPPTGTGLTQFLLCSAVTGTVQGYAYKSSFADRYQFSRYVAGQRYTAL